MEVKLLKSGPRKVVTGFFRKGGGTDKLRIDFTGFQHCQGGKANLKTNKGPIKLASATQGTR